MRLLGIDYGEKKIGVARSDERGMVAFPLVVLSNNEHAVRQLCDIAVRERAELFVIGDTKTARGEVNEITAALRKFADALARASGLPVELQPEHGTSAAARAALPEGAVRGILQSPHSSAEGDLDARAAALILQRFIDAHRLD